MLHHLEKFTVHRLDLPTLYSVSAKTPEESCAQASRNTPSLLKTSHVQCVVLWACSIIVVLKMCDDGSQRSPSTLFFNIRVNAVICNLRSVCRCFVRLGAVYPASSTCLTSVTGGKPSVRQSRAASSHSCRMYPHSHHSSSSLQQRRSTSSSQTR